MGIQELISVENIYKTFTVRGMGARKMRVEAVKDVSLSLLCGETVAVVGESGSGKTTLSRIILGLLKPSSGEVKYQGMPVQDFRGRQMKAYRKDVQAVFQDPYSSLNPKMKIGSIIMEPLNNFGYHGDSRHRVAELLETVGLSGDLAWRYPHQCSSGQKQRVAIARALAVDPKAIILDEPLSSLDITVQTQIISLLNKLKAGKGVAYLLITHDLRVVRVMADRVAVMYKGSMVETAAKDEFFQHPGHPHSQALMEAVPSIDGLQKMKVTV